MSRTRCGEARSPASRASTASESSSGSGSGHQPAVSRQRRIRQRIVRFRDGRLGAPIPPRFRQRLGRWRHLFTGREGDGYHNRRRWHRRPLSHHRYSLSEVPGARIPEPLPDEIAEDYSISRTGSFSDQAYRVRRTATTRGTGRAGRKYEDIGEDFRADMGFMPQVDFRHGATGFEHSLVGRRRVTGTTASSSAVSWDRTVDQSGQQLAAGNRESGVGLINGPLPVLALGRRGDS